MPKRNEAPYGGVFEGMDFPNYEYQHYPLMMRKGSGKLSETRIVENEAQEHEAVSDGFTPPERVGPPVSLTEKEHKNLTSQIEDAKAVASAKEAENEELRKTLAELRGHLAGGKAPVPAARTTGPTASTEAKPTETKPAAVAQAPAVPPKPADVAASPAAKA